MPIGTCQVCGEPARLYRCDDHHRCDDCGSKEGVVYRDGGVTCGRCHAERCERRIADFAGETQYTSEPVCPHCGETQGDAWEMSEGENDCGYCERSFHMERYVEVEYSTCKSTE